ncbi:MAG TPA: alpha-E domain-containing protein [Candidatus Macondimonas sp.]|nr:alpha-E domain-containing protein [Candidatus Macondimonas sp.]
MLSRMAENMYWFARYLERAENTARLVTVTTNLMLDLPRHVTADWGPLVDITGSREAFMARHGEMSEHRVVQFLLADRDNPGSLISSLTKARENLRTTRDIVPSEAWEQINRIHLLAQDKMGEALSRRGRHEFLQVIVGHCQQIVGLLGGAMSRDEAYVFMRLGRYLERADMTTRILDVRSGDLLAEIPSDLMAYSRLQWMSVLKSLTAYQMYRRLVRSRVSGVDVVRFLLREERFPRSLQACIRTLEEGLAKLPHQEAPLRAVAQLKSLLQRADIGALAHESGTLHLYMDELQLKLAACHNAIVATYFSLESMAPPGGPLPHETTVEPLRPSAQSQSQAQAQHVN